VRDHRLLALPLPVMTFSGDAVRDREYMRDCAKRDWKANPFMLHSTNIMESGLMDSLKRKGVNPNAVITHSVDRKRPTLPGEPWDFRSSLRANWERNSMALGGSLILVGPTILMVLVHSTLVRLLTVGISTALFAIANAQISTSRSPFELLSATAAYTAILVVFVGSSSTV
jgi:hypothetical protein